MGKRSTVKGYWRAHGGTEASSSKLTGPSPAVVPVVLAVTFDGAAANTTATGKYLPVGAIITGVHVVSGHTGGTTPAFDIGLLTATPDPDAILNGAVSTTTSEYFLSAAQAGASVGVALTEDAEISAGDDGTGTAGTGNITAYIAYTFDDDGSRNN